MRSPLVRCTILRRRPLLAAAFLAAVAGASCSSPPEPDGTERPAVPVRVATVQAEPVAGSFEAGGTVRALTVAPLSSRIVSPILEIHVAPGDRVRRGQRLITLDARQLTATAATAGSTLNATMRGAGAAEADERAAQAALELAKTSHARIASLRERNSATAGELDEAVAALRAAEARLDMVQARRAEVNDAITAARSGAESAQVTASYAVISAPFDGLVTESPAQAGAMATPGVPLIVVEDTRRYRLEASVDATRAGAVTVGSVVPVLVTGLDQVDGTVAEISESIDPGAHTFIVKIDLPPLAGLRSGLFGRARFAIAGTPGIAVPEEAVLRRGQLTLVFVEQDGVARMRLIHAGPTVDGRVRVLAGLEAGDRLIQNPPATLLDGAPIAVQPGRLP